MIKYYNRQGEIIPEEEWLRLMKLDLKYRRIAFDSFGDLGDVSTVWLGLDHQFGFNGPPLIFETLVFRGPLADEMERYSTEKEAIQGHALMVERLKNYEY